MTIQERSIDRILAAVGGTGYDNRMTAHAFWQVIRASVRATVPGRQQGKNLEPLLEAAVTASVRRLRVLRNRNWAG